MSSPRNAGHCSSDQSLCASSFVRSRWVFSSSSAPWFVSCELPCSETTVSQNTTIVALRPSHELKVALTAAHCCVGFSTCIAHCLSSAQFKKLSRHYLTSATLECESSKLVASLSWIHKALSTCQQYFSRIGFRNQFRPLACK